MQLDKYEEKQVAQISELQAKANELAVKAKEITVSDDASLKEARQVIKDINAYKNEVKDKRLALTQPLNNVISQLITKEKEVLLPLDEGKNDVSTKILDYSAEVERKRLEEERRIEAITEKMIDMFDMRVTQVETIDKAGAELKDYFSNLPESDQSNPTIKVAFMTTVAKLSDHKEKIIEQERAAAERKRQEEEAARLAEEAKKQSVEEARIAAERKEIEDQKRAIEEEKLQIERDKAEMERQKELQKAEAEALKHQKSVQKEAAARPKTNAVTSTKFEITDEDKVGRIYCSPDESKIREAIKMGVTDIAGVRIFTETKVR